MKINLNERHPNFFVKLGSCSFLLKSLNSTLKVSIQKQKEQLTHPPTHNFLKLVEGWFSLSFSSHRIQKIFSISHFQFSKFQNSWQLKILSKLPLFKLDSKVALTCFTLLSQPNLWVSSQYLGLLVSVCQQYITYLSSEEPN